MKYMTVAKSTPTSLPSKSFSSTFDVTSPLSGTVTLMRRAAYVRLQCVIWSADQRPPETDRSHDPARFTESLKQPRTVKNQAVR